MFNHVVFPGHLRLGFLFDMPSLPKRNKRKQDNERPRVPSGDIAFYNTKWGNVSKLYRKLNPLCEMCKASGKLTDASPGDRKGVTDHIVSVSNGGARMDERNFMTLCKQCHDRKSALEKNGWTCDKGGDYGEYIPINKAEAIKTLIK